VTVSCADVVGLIYDNERAAGGGELSEKLKLERLRIVQFVWIEWLCHWGRGRRRGGSIFLRQRL